MKDVHRNMALAAAAALTLAVAPSAAADVRIQVQLPLPLPPPPHEVLRHLPLPPLPVVEVRHDDRYGHTGRWTYENRYRNDRYADRHDSRYRAAARWAYVEGRWVARPYRGAVWVTGSYDRWGRWVPGYWVRARYR